MATGILIASTVPVGHDISEGTAPSGRNVSKKPAPASEDISKDYIVSVHISPQQLSNITPSTLQQWANDVVSGDLTFDLISPQLANPLPAVLDKKLIHTELWADLFSDVSASASTTGVAIGASRPNVGYLTVNLKSTLDNAIDFYETYIDKIDVNAASVIDRLHAKTVALSCKHSVFALNNSCPNDRTTGSDVRTYLKTNLGKNLAATRVFGNVNVDAAFPANGKAQNLNPSAEAEIDVAHTPNPQPELGAGSRQHIVHHINRLRSVSRKAPANISQSSLNAAAKSSGRVLTPMSFSQRLTLLQGMPVLLEALGLVLIFRIPWDTNLTVIQKLKTQVSYKGTVGSYSNMSVVSPWTAVNGSLFLPQPQPTPAPPESVARQNPIIRTDNGYIDVNTKSDYWMGSLQPESAANHVYNFANRAVMRLNNSAGNKLQAVTQKPDEDYTHVILPPSPHTDGFYVYQHRRQNRIREKLEDQVAQPAATNDTVRYAEDLFHSYAVDMKDASAKGWSRLTLRDEKYFKRNNLKDPLIEAKTREHGVRSSGVRPTDTVPTMSQGEADEAAKHQIDETIFTWRGGSLAVKDSSNSPIPSQTNGSLSTQQFPWGDKFCGKFTVSDDAAIPTELFGGAYSFALRPVYITGRARPFNPDLAAASIIPDAPRFLRNEMVLGPRLIKKAHTGSAENDTQNLMFVSSRIKNPRAIMAPNQMALLEVSGVIESSLRYLVPAACTSVMASRHGKSGHVLLKGAKTVPMKKGKKGSKDGALPDTLPIPADEVDDTTVYLPDPICDGVRANLFFIGNAALPNATNQLSVRLSYYQQENKWPDYTLHCIELRRGKPGLPPRLTSEDTFWGVNHVAMGGEFGSKTIVCTLPPGMTAVLELTPTIAAEFKDIHAFAPTSTAIEDTTICRPTILRMTHATDVPVTVPDFKLDGAVQEQGQPVEAKHGKSKDKQKKSDEIPVFAYDRSGCSSPGVTTIYEPYTTGKVGIEASWSEEVDNPADTTNPPGRQPQKASIFSRQLPKLPATRTGSDVGSVYDTDDSCSSSPSCSASPANGTTCPTAKLPFNDSRYRRVELAMSGVSRYEKVLAEKQHGAAATRRVFYDFLSTAPPPVPDVEYVLPTFEWRVVKKFHKHTQTRKCGLAVILNRPWFASGEGEQLAVLLPSTSQCTPSKIPGSTTVPIPAQYPPGPGSSTGPENTVSSWGTHAIWNFVENSGMTISIENTSSCGSVAIKGQTYDFALFNPIYDEVEQKWYCNLSFSKPPVYGALMCLVLARYQPHSAKTDWTLSPPTVADFAFLGPERVLRVKRSWSTLDVTISGIGLQGQLQTKFDVHIATEKDRDTTEFPWREPDSFATNPTSDASKQILWRGSLKFDPFATNSLVVREYETFQAFEVQPNGGPQPMRDRLVYASATDIPALL